MTTKSKDDIWVAGLVVDSEFWKVGVCGLNSSDTTVEVDHLEVGVEGEHSKCVRDSSEE